MPSKILHWTTPILKDRFDSMSKRPMLFQRCKAWKRSSLASLAVCVCLILFPACGKRETRVEAGIRDQVLHKGNGTEPQDIDPHTTTGDVEHAIMMAVLEGLVAEAPDDLHPVPGVAERWDISSDRTVYTFHLRTNALWSDGGPVTAHDFVNSFERILSPQLAAE